MVLVSTLLDGRNYHAWNRSIKMALLSKNKKEEAHYEEWARMNNMVISWTLHSMVPDIAQTILWCDTASEAWDDLKERSYEGDAFRITDIQEEISSIKQGGSSVWEYYTKLKLLWDEVKYVHLFNNKSDRLYGLGKEMEETKAFFLLGALNQMEIRYNKKEIIMVVSQFVAIVIVPDIQWKHVIKSMLFCFYTV
nr:retrovirus-related Pol polyprotein from transposon TNT 1-94 [Ipomoea batatas]